jgi:hypothetical protein
LTPNDIDVLLHYYVSPEEHDRVTAPAVRETIARFKAEGILEARSETNRTNHGSSYNVTPKGEILINMLCDTPFPESYWRDPRGKA